MRQGTSLQSLVHGWEAKTLERLFWRKVLLVIFQAC